MNTSTLSIQYQASHYDDSHRLLPDSAHNRMTELSGILRHINGIGELFGLADTEKLEALSSERLNLLFANTGELLGLLTNAAFAVLSEEQTESQVKQGT